MVHSGTTTLWEWGETMSDALSAETIFSQQNWNLIKQIFLSLMYLKKQRFRTHIQASKDQGSCMINLK